MERRFGYDFGSVSVHTDADAQDSARQLNAQAYTVGKDVYFAAGRFSPRTVAGRLLLAHELTHTIQQSGGMQVQRACSSDDECDAAVVAPVAAPTPSQTGAPRFLEAGWQDVNSQAVVYKEGTQAEEGGAYLRASPDPGAPIVKWVPQNTKLFVLRREPTTQWMAVTALSEAGGTFGYVAEWLVALNPPDPEAGVVKIKPGDTPLELAARYYSGKGFDVWSKDKRYVVNALVWVNAHAKHNFKGNPVISKRKTRVGWTVVEGGLEAPWWTAQVQAGGYIWLPGADYLNSIYEQVAEHGGGTGSITGDMWRTVKKIYRKAAYALAFVGGLVHGFGKSLWDALAGVAHLIGGVLKSVFTLNVLSDVGGLIDTMKKVTWDEIKQALGEWAAKWDDKLNSSSPWVAGHAHGYLTGYVMAEAAMLLLTGGTLAAAKQALWTSRLGKALQETRAFQKLAEGVAKAGELGDKAKVVVKGVVETAEKGRMKPVVQAVRVTATVMVWTAQGIGKILNLPAEILRYLGTKVIEQLKRLEPWFGRIAKLSRRAKRWLFGCKSPCVIDVDRMLDAMALTDEAIERQAESYVRRRYARELADNPRLEEQLAHAEEMHAYDPHGAKQETAEVVGELEAMRKEAHADPVPKRKEVDPYFRDMEAVSARSKAEALERRKLALEMQRRMPAGTKVKVESTPLTDAGVAQNVAASRGKQLPTPDVEYSIDLPPEKRRLAELPARNKKKPALGVVKPDDIRFYGKRGEKYLLLDHKEVEGLWGGSYYGSPAGREKLSQMLQRHLRVADAMGPKCMGWGYTTNNEALAKFLAEEIKRMGPSAKGRLFAPGDIP